MKNDEHKKAPVCETEAVATSNDLNATATDAGPQEAIKQTSAPSQVEEKQHGGYFPVGKKDYRRFITKYPQHASRLCLVWNVLLDEASRSRSHTFKLTTEQLAQRCACSSRTIDYRLNELRALKMIKTHSKKNPETRKQEVKVFTIKPDVPVCKALQTAQSVADGKPPAVDDPKLIAYPITSPSSFQEEEGEKVIKRTPSVFSLGPSPSGAPRKPSSSGDWAADALAALEEYQ
jgi:hypothetical protein